MYTTVILLYYLDLDDIGEYSLQKYILTVINSDVEISEIISHFYKHRIRTQQQREAWFSSRPSVL